MQTHQWHQERFKKTLQFLYNKIFNWKYLFTTVEQAVTAMCAFTEHHELRQRWTISQTGSDTLLCFCPTSFRGNGSVFCTGLCNRPVGLCKWVHKSNLYSLRVLHRNLHPYEMVTGCSSIVSSRVPQFHTWSLRSTQRAQGTGVSARTKSEPTLTDAVCFKSLLHIWMWTLSGCLCLNSLRAELILQGGTYTGCRQPWSTTWNTQG